MAHEKRYRFAALLLFGLPALVRAEEAKPKAAGNCPLAILPFRESGEEVKGLGTQASDLLFASLAKEPKLWLVDREDLTRTLAEQEINLSGVVNPGDAVKIGQINGAKILVTGSVFQASNSLYVVGKVIGTETTRVLGVSAKGAVSDGIDGVVARLAADISKTIAENASQLVAAPVEKADRIKVLKDKLAQAERPNLFVTITEQHVIAADQPRPVRRPIDPAAETEFVMFCNET